MSAVDENVPVEYEYDRLEPVPVVYGYVGVAVSVLFFQAVNQVVVRVSRPKSVVEEDYWKWRNLLVSWIHAVVIGVWDLSCFFLFPELMTDLIAFHNMYIYLMVTFSTGYFVYDFIDLFVSKQALKMWELIPHHISVAGTFFFNVVQSRCLAFNVVALLAEVNSVFLHARKLMQMAGVPYGRRLYRVNSVMNLFTFVSCRFLCLAWIVYGMWMWHARVSPIYLVVLGATMFILWVTNAVLFWRLLCSDVLRGRRQKQRASSADPKTNRHLNSNGFGHSTKSAVNGVALNGTSSQHDFENNHAQLQQCEDSHPCYSNNSLLHRTSVQSTDVNGVMNDGLKNSL